MNNTPAPYKLVLVLQDLEFGGTQRYALNLLQHLDRSLFTPELWVLRGGEDMARIAQRTEVRIKWFSKSSWVTPLALLRFFVYLAGHRPVVLYPLTVVPNIWARIFGSLLGVPVIISSYRNLIAHQYERVLWPLSTHIICNAAAIRDKLIQKHHVKVERISVVPNGVDTALFQPDYAKQASQPTLIYAGRLVAQKDPLTLLDCFRIVQQTIPQVKMLIIGNGPLRPHLESYIKQQCLTQQVTITSGTIDIRNHLQQAWVFLLSSLYEGSPNILIEAMACGLPVISTRTKGIPELIEHGVNGFMVPPGDSERMAALTIQLLQDGNARAEMGRRARIKAVSNHNLEKCVRLTETNPVEPARLFPTIEKHYCRNFV